MNSIVRSAFRLPNLRPLLNGLRTAVHVRNGLQHRQIARNLWYMCNVRNYDGKSLNTHSDLCSCGCGKQKMHTKAEKELVEFLTEEILAERKAQKVKTIPTEIDGFKAQLNGSEVTFTKQSDKETIRISFNVNHTVDDGGEPDITPNMDKPDLGELKSKPQFKIELIRGDTTVHLVCSFVEPQEQEEGYNDIFGIDEVSIYSGKWSEQVYAVSGEFLDTYLYDLLLNYIEEKGISNAFVEKLSQYSTSYEHSAYIGLLEGLSKYASGK